ncbi:MAG TPA: OmpH family outer membrane protein [Rhodanobacteraceae bacterium]
MSFQRVLIAAGVAGALMLPLASVHAAQKNGNLGNSSVPGVCMLSRGAVLADSKVGKAADARLKQLVQQADSQLKAEQAPLQTAIQQFQAKAKSMTDAERTSQQKSLQQRMQAFELDQRKLNARVQLTRQQVTERIGNVVNPLVASAYKQRSCGILLNRDDVLGGNGSNDLTAAVIHALDGKMTTISFSLAPLPKQSSGN